MEIKQVNTFKFNELTDEQKEKAIYRYYDINVDYDWWENVYYDADQVGIEITSFDTDNSCYGKIFDVLETATKIVANHGESCDTYKTAAEYLKDRAELVKKYADPENPEQVQEDNEYDFDNECDGLDEEFERAILEDYRVILFNEYDYLTSEEAIAETLIANEYDFTENGEIF